MHTYYIVLEGIEWSGMLRQIYYERMMNTNRKWIKKLEGEEPLPFSIGPPFLFGPSFGAAG